MAYIIDNGIIQITLTSANPVEEIDLSILNLSIREFIVGANSVFGGAVVKISRFISTNTGYTPYLQPFTEDDFVITKSGAGRSISFDGKRGKVKFEAISSTGTTSIKIDILI